ncbi:uncharacterized protein Fot_07823 [Forsythia ovata]|uniref:DUF7138 domain-containing protein n=1 Tax=Forsythia ovata TaxID=205694 RepID=A0ABD1WWX3_9LAMI
MSLADGWTQPEAPVVFFNGEWEEKFGNVPIYPGLEYRQFELNVSQMVSFLPSQISIYLVKNLNYPVPEGPEIIRANENINFTELCFEKDIIFLVLLERSGMPRNPFDLVGNDFLEHTRRNETAPLPRRYSEVLQAPPSNLEVQRENNQATPILNTDSVLNMNASRLIVSTNENENGFCQHGEMASFHPCVNDPVITGFRTPVGPIAQPIEDPVITEFRTPGGLIARPINDPVCTWLRIRFPTN